MKFAVKEFANIPTFSESVCASTRCSGSAQYSTALCTPANPAELLASRPVVRRAGFACIHIRLGSDPPIPFVPATAAKASRWACCTANASKFLAVPVKSSPAPFSAVFAASAPRATFTPALTVPRRSLNSGPATITESTATRAFPPIPKATDPKPTLCEGSR